VDRCRDKPTGFHCAMNKSNQADFFLRLRDTPDSYAGSGSQMMRVNATGTGIEFSGAIPFANLPAGALGAIQCVNNGSAGLAWGDTVTGGGTAKYLVWFNGANWKVIGK
jgi:hypothetical protein